MTVINIFPLINEEISTEYIEVTTPPKFRFPQEPVQILLNAIIRRDMQEEFILTPHQMLEVIDN